jgi:hypothetical protein
MAKLVNPFFFESPSDRWAFTDREELLPALLSLMSERGRRLLVHGRRRMGKTSLMQHAAKQSGAVFIYYDISKAASLGEMAEKLMEEAPPVAESLVQRVKKIAQKHFKTVTFSAADKVVLSGELRPDDAVKTLEDVLNFFDERARELDEPWTICFDEFQDIRKLMGERAAWKLRGITQHHRNVNYLLSGSDHRLMKWITSPDAGFFKQLAQLEVGPIDSDHMAGWIERRAKIGGMPAFPFGAEIVKSAGPCTGDIARLAKVTFDLAGSKSKDDVVAAAFDAIALNELNTEFGAYWRDLSQPQRLVLRAVAQNKPPQAAATLRQMGIKSASTAQSGIETLLDKQLLVRIGSKLDFDNPFFRRWVSMYGMPPIRINAK